MTNWWQKGSLRTSKGFTSPWRLHELRAEDVPGEVQKSVDIHSNVVQVQALRIGTGCGTDPSYAVFKSETIPNDNPDLLKVYVEEYHKKGLHMFIYFNGHSFVPETTYAQHKDWVTIKEDGSELMTVYGNGMSACLNNEDYRAWQASIIKDWCKYDIDGVFLDGDIFFAPNCFCETCKAKFKAKYNMALPKKSDRKNPNWRYLREFQIDSVTEYVGYLYQTLKENKPTALLYCNAALRGPNWTTGRNNRRLMEVQDILLSEAGFLYGNLNKWPIWRTECENKLCRTIAGDKPVISGMAVAHKNWSYFGMAEKELQLMLYSAVSAGSMGSAAFASTKNDVSSAMQAIGDVYAFVEKNEDKLYPVKNAARTAVVWSYQNADFYAGSEVIYTDFTDQSVKSSDIGNINKEFEGFYDICFRSHQLVDVLDEQCLWDGSLQNVDTLMLPNIACMSQKEMDGVREFVQSGGTLIASFETSLYNEFGEKRETFGLEDLFGIKGDPKLVQPGEHNYISPVVQNVLSLPHLAGYTWVPAPTYGLFVEKSTATSALDFIGIMEGRYDSVPNKTDNGYLMVNSYGKGKVYYFAGTVGEALMEMHHPQTMDTLKEIFKTCAPQSVKLLNDQYESVGFNVMKNQNTGDLMIYLTNFTGSMNRPIRETIPLYDLTLALDFKPKKLVSLMDKDNVTVEETVNGLKVHIKKLQDFEAIACEM